MEVENFYPLVPPETDLTSFGAAGLLIFYAFSGFEVLAIAAEEMDNPKRNLPLAIFAIIGITSILYLLTQVTLIGILGPDLADSDVPLASAAEKIGGSYGMFLVMICMIISSAGTNLAASFIAPRSGTALARDGMISKAISLPGKFGTPTLAILITTILAISIALTGSFAKLATISVIARFVQYFSTCLAVLFLRRNRPDLTSSFPKILGPAIPLVALFFIVLLMGCASIDELLYGLSGLAIGVPIYFIQKCYNSQWPEVLEDVVVEEKNS